MPFKHCMALDDWESTQLAVYNGCKDEYNSCTCDLPIKVVHDGSIRI
jgi:hypothetical protein